MGLLVNSLPSHRHLLIDTVLTDNFRSSLTTLDRTQKNQQNPGSQNCSNLKQQDQFWDKYLPLPPEIQCIIDDSLLDFINVFSYFT